MTQVLLKPYFARQLIIVAVVSSIFVFHSCSLSDTELKEKVKIKFSYYRQKDNILLSLDMYYFGKNKVLPPDYEIIFIKNNTKSVPPIRVNMYSFRKWWWPGYPKGGYTYTTEKDLSEFLGVGTHEMKWMYGPLVSNTMILKVNMNNTIEEIQVECEDDVKRLGQSAFKTKKKRRPHGTI